MRTVEEIDQELRELQAEIGRVEGQSCEVYTRIVGYYRNIKNFNAGKREELKHRKNYKGPENG
jgi:anaerobic ribonucleoside-triphosphate reductase